MADVKITALTAETTPAAADLIPIVDVSDTTQSVNGSTQKVTYENFFTNVGAIESNVSTVAATGSTETLDLSLYGVFDVTMDAGCTFTFSNPAPSGKATVFVLILRGAFSPVFPASVDWGDASAPTYTTPSVYSFVSVDGGTTYLGAQVGKGFA
jgi:hypothetical protein